ncbi:MAG TPA: hypothetical protein VK469_20430 [Candidatus Kapabacteria bacterium]|nr:hypothetical protein [Candidatus Kapabacteria bacterium]
MPVAEFCKRNNIELYIKEKTLPKEKNTERITGKSKILYSAGKGIVSILVLMEEPLPGQAGKHEIRSTKFETNSKFKSSKFKALS